MSVFNYSLPSGSQFVVRGPATATQTEADQIFYEQVAAGALVGYESGQVLTSPATTLTKFELSRLDRGTAGVETNIILAISQGLPTTASGFLTQSILSDLSQVPGLQNNLSGSALLPSLKPLDTIEQGNLPTGSLATQTVLSAIQSLPVPIGIPNLTNVVLTNPVDEADIAAIRANDLPPNAIAANAITALTEYQVQKLLAQTAALVNQESDQLSLDKGIGRYGFTSYALEQAGYVKPGTSATYFESNPNSFVTTMSSPSVWTGKGGVYSVTDLLDDGVLQNRIQVQLMQQGYDELVANGTIRTIPTPSVSVSTGQVYTNTGLQSVSTLSKLSLLGTNLGSLSGVAQNALASSTALNRLLQTTSIDLSTIGSGAVNSLTSGLNNLGNLAGSNFSSITANLTNRITGGVGSLVVNASKFGSEATALWAKSGGLTGISTQLANLSNLSLGSIQNQLGSLTGTVSGQIGSLTSNINNITKNLTNLIPGSLDNLTSNLNIFGKASGFATNFANPLASLNNLGNIGNIGGILNSGIGGAISGQIGSIGTTLQTQLGSISGALQGQIGSLSTAFGNLGGFANIGAVGDLFGGGGDLIAGTSVAGGFNNTVNRATVDAAFARIVGSSKVPLPVFEYPSLAAIGPRLDIQQAQNFLSQASSSRTFGQTVTV